MILYKIVKGIFGQSTKKEWLDRLVKEIENHRYNFDSLPFKIVGLKETGFLVKVNGLFAFISFYHMPWKYFDTDCWRVIYPKFVGKTFFCKVYKINKDPLSIIINGEIPQFKKADLIIGNEYKGIIIKMTEYGAFIDIGYHFDWKYGSLVGLLHKTQLKDTELLEDFHTGQEIKTIYGGLNESEKIIFCNDMKKIAWQLENPEELIGQTVWAKVIRQTESKTVKLLVKGKYSTTLTISKKDYPTKIIRTLRQAKNDLKDGEIINCEVKVVNQVKKTIKVKWITNIGTEIEIDNSLKYNLDTDTLQALTNLKNEIQE